LKLAHPLLLRQTLRERRSRNVTKANRISV
jgi:hypothetical protein